LKFWEAFFNIFSGTAEGFEEREKWSGAEAILKRFCSAHAAAGHRGRRAIQRLINLLVHRESEPEEKLSPGRYPFLC